MPPPIIIPSILKRLDIDPGNRVYLTKNFVHPIRDLVGAVHHVRQACNAIGNNWALGISQCAKLFSSA